MAQRRWMVLGLVAAGLLGGIAGANESQPDMMQPATPAALEGPDGSAAGSQAPEAEPMRVSMEFQDANLKDVLKTFSKETGINLIAGKDVANEPVTIYLDRVTVMDALDQILTAANLTYDRLPGSEIYIVRSLDANRQGPPTVTRIYQLRYARVSKSVLAKAAARFSEITPFESKIVKSSSQQGSSGGGGGDGSAEAVGIDVVVQTLLTKAGSVVVDSRTNRLIVTDVQENFPRVEAALAALDVRTAQILVDAELIETTVSKLKDLGIEWGQGTEGDLFSVVPASRASRFPFSSFWGKPLGQGGGAGQLSVQTPGSITFGTVGSSSATAVLQALQTDGDTKILARPKVLTLDNESAIIRLTSEEAIGFENASQSTTGTTTSTPERTTTGVVLVVTPQINEQGYITMLVEPTVTKTVASKITPPTGQAVPRDPKTRSSRTLVRIRTGDTLVIGGLIDRSDEQSLKSVPILSGIPFVGEAFKNTEVNNSTSELIAFVTPRILDEPTESQLAAAPQSPLGAREQEGAGSQSDAIEQRLNALE